jgi:DNA uptake protein ComE-like DNA-binding protein
LADGSATNGTAADEAVELELLALKLRQDPHRPLLDAMEVRRAAALGWRLDVNRATAADWTRLPGIQARQVDLLLRLQAGGVQLSGPEDLHQALEWPADRIAAWLPVLEFRWYGDAPPLAGASPIDVNRAAGTALESLGLSPDQRLRLQRERARRPFRDLAELQQRLQLPSSLVEGWIGRVRFSAGPAGPVLPLARRS